MYVGVCVCASVSVCPFCDCRCTCIYLYACVSRVLEDVMEVEIQLNYSESSHYIIYHLLMLACCISHDVIIEKMTFFVSIDLSPTEHSIESTGLPCFNNASY